MAKIRRKNPEGLKGKQVDRKGKAFLGYFTLSLALAMQSGLIFGIATVQAQNSYEISKAQQTEILSEIANLKGKEKTEAVAQYFEEAIRNNSYIDEDKKGKIIKAYTDRVIKRYGQFFDADTIANMYSIAVNERVTKLEFNTNWLAGQYEPFSNTIRVEDISEADVVSHEENHAVVCGDFVTSGLSNAGFGAGINEGLNSIINGDASYRILRKYTHFIGTTIGYDVLINSFYHHNINELIMELNQYLSIEDSHRLINYMDKLNYWDTCNIRYTGDENSKIQEYIQLRIDYYEDGIKEILFKLKSNVYGENPTIKLPDAMKNYAIIGESVSEVYRT